jgi:MFS family permease
MREGAIALGLRANWRQFALLAIDNLFVGMLIGSERAIVPLLGQRVFGIDSLAVLFSFIVSFGLAKGPLNLLAGRLADHVGRRPVLLIGWMIGLPVPWLILLAPSWGWIVAANLLLGANQAFAWTMTVTSKIDLVGPRQRGLALGINEFTGYTGVAMASAGTGFLADQFGLRPVPFLAAAAVTAAGLLLALLAIRETVGFTHLEAPSEPSAPKRTRPSLGQVFRQVSWEDHTLFACSQAGMINKFSDTAVWGLVPVAMAAQGLGIAVVGLAAGVYALSWGAGQLATGALSDRIGRKPPIVAGMVLNAIGLVLAAAAMEATAWLAAAMIIGVGTALLYPVLLAAVSDEANPKWRGTALGVYRLWRDGGYALGGIAVGLAASWLAPRGAFLGLGLVVFASALLVLWQMRETRPSNQPTVRDGPTLAPPITPERHRGADIP